MSIKLLVLAVAPIAAAACGSGAIAPQVPSFAQVSAGNAHTCALTPGGAAYCWGRNDFGQLGVGTYDSTAHTAPAPVAGGLRFVTVQASNGFSCGLSTSGGIYCWGLNSLGQLGTVSASQSCSNGLPCLPSPVIVTGGVRFVALGSGASFACGASVNGTGYCWGANDRGQLGIGTLGGQSLPVPVSGAAGYVAVAAGGNFACGIAAMGGVLCWGANDRGQLGNGDLNTRLVPTPVTGSSGFLVLSAGTYHACVLVASGAAYCWGHNHYGRLGNGSFAIADWPSPQAVVGALVFAGVSAGDTHTCGVTAGAVTYCWGHNDRGQLGIGAADTLTHPSPELVAGVPGAAAVSAGTTHSCAVTSGGAAYCWGDNAFGELGDGTTAGSTIPVKVVGHP